MLNEILEKDDLASSSNEITDPLFELVTDDDRKKYLCKAQGCGKYFRYKSEIVRHTATHSESRPFICQYESCLKAFKRNDALENHIRSTHTKETPFTCPVQECGLKFTTHGSFRYHVLKHNKNISEEDLFAHEQDAFNFFNSQPSKQVKLGEFADNVALNYQAHDAAYLKINKDKQDAEFYTPPPKFASKIKWEMVSEETECESTVQKKEDVPYEQYMGVVEENKVLKDKLSNSGRMIQTMQKQINDLLSNLFVCQSRLGNLSGPVFSNTPEVFPPNAFPVQNNFSYQGNFQNNKIKEETLQQLGAANYGNNVMPKQSVEGQFNMESSSSIDKFLSFGKDF